MVRMMIGWLDSVIMAQAKKLLESSDQGPK